MLGGAVHVEADLNGCRLNISQAHIPMIPMYAVR